MAEVDSRQAASLIGVSIMLIHRRADDGTLKVRRVGMHRRIWVELDDLRDFAARYNYRINEKLVAQYTGQPQP
jgi:hypothetical protein